MKQKKEKDKRPPLDRGILMAMKALDNQIAREMQRSPADREQHGVQKWDPYNKRIEDLCGKLVAYLGEGECQLDSLLVMSQALTKALYLVVDQLAEEGLGDLRSDYCSAAMENIERDARLAIQTLGKDSGPILV